MPAIAFRDVTKVFDGGQTAQNGQPKAAVRDITFDIEVGEFVVLLGPSGCGKTTLMRMVNRLIEPTSGQILIDSTDIRAGGVTELRRRIGYVIQQVGLFPHMTVAQNIAVVPKLLGWDNAKTSSRTDELLDLVDLPPAEYRKRYPRQLSGGQQQRVGIARAMAADPNIMLMDEPFGAIDAITRADLQNELLSIQREVVKTVIFVTHDVEEALRLADRIAVMRDGRLVQYDAPLQLLMNPANDFVRALVGSEDVFRQLSLLPVSSLMGPANGTAAADGLSIDQNTDIRSALSTLITHGAREITVVDARNTPVGRLTLSQILAEGVHEQTPPPSSDVSGSREPQ